jgi:hypothetical protein
LPLPSPPPLARHLAPLLLAAAAAVAQAGPACPPQPPRALLERFVAAPCVRCWQAKPPPLRENRDAWVLDWVVPPRTTEPAVDPSPSHRQAGATAWPAQAALPDAAQRMTTHGLLGSDEMFSISHPLAVRSALALQVSHTPLPDGRIELRLAARFTSQRPLPAGLQGWLALVERIPAGAADSPVDRQVVRALAGPLPLEGLARRPIDHLRTVAAPATGQPERLAALGWVETNKGRVIAAGRGPLADCPTP